MRRVSWCALAAAAALFLAGCGGDTEAAGPDEPTPTTSEASESGSTATTEPSAEPSVAPADGAEVTVGNMTLRLPRGFPPRQVNDLLVTATGPKFDRIAVSAASSIDDNTTDEMAAIVSRSDSWAKPPRRLEDVTVAGEPMFHLVGPDDMGYSGHEFGGQVDGWDVRIYVGGTDTPARQEAIAAAVLASVEFG
jgi:hypothetical protein